jgi:hypothetical protein
LTIAFGAAGTKVAGGTSSIALGYPSSVGAGDMLVATANGWTGTNIVWISESGWDFSGNITGGTASNNDDHSSAARGDCKVAAGGESGTVTFDTSAAGGGSSGTMFRYTKTASSWVTPTAFASAAGPNGNTTSYSATTGSLNLAAGDWVVVIFGQGTDAANTFSSLSLSSSGITFGTITRRDTGAGSTGGVDGNCCVFDAPVTAGSGTNAVTFSATLATGSQGPTVIARLREATATPTRPKLGRRALQAVNRGACW